MSPADGRGLDFIGTDFPDAEVLAASLAAETTFIVPAPPRVATWDWDWSDALDTWSSEIASLPVVDRVVVCTWCAAAPNVPLVELDPVHWRQRVEWPTALWFSTVVAAAGRCADGGSLVVVMERPATLDAEGQSPVVAVADGLTNLVRSLAAREGARGVRVNAVLSALHTGADGLRGAPPPLPTFPGRIDVEIAGAVRMLLSDDARGITGTSLSATSGRR